MSLTATDTKKIIEKYQKNPGDCGSTEVQIAILTAKIQDLTPHFKNHPHDYHSRRGLLRMVSQRRKLLTYLKKVSLTSYRELIKELGLRS